MTLRLVSSGDDRALAIRDHILPLLREYGALEVQRDTVRVVELKIDNWTFRHWTPFNELTAGEASSPGYRHAIERQHTKPDLPYGLDVSHGEKVLSSCGPMMDQSKWRPSSAAPGKTRRWSCKGLSASSSSTGGGVRVSEDGMTDRPACIGSAAGSAAG
jgi:hypothetical protein